MNLHEYLDELERAHRIRVAADRAEDALTKPIIPDVRRIKDVYEMFTMSVRRISDKPAKDPDNRRVFIFVCLRLFCPKAFVGNVITYGVCEEMAKILGCHKSLISHNVRNLRFIYKKYRDFREKVDTMYDEIMKMIEEK